MAGTIPENYIEAKLTVSREMADAVCNYIIDNITSGLVLEEEDESTVTAITFYVTPDKESVFRTGLPLYLSDVFGSLNQAPPVVSGKDDQKCRVGRGVQALDPAGKDRGGYCGAPALA